jgi:hypothetical protein
MLFQIIINEIVPINSEFPFCLNGVYVKCCQINPSLGIFFKLCYILLLWYKPHLFRIMVLYLNIMSLVYNHIQKHCFLHCHSQSETNLRLKFQLNLTAVTVWRLWLKWGQWVCMIVHVQLNYVSITIKQQSEHFLKLLISTIQNLFDKTKYFYFLIIYLKMLCSLLSLTPHYYLGK